MSFIFVRETAYDRSNNVQFILVSDRLSNVFNSVHVSL